MLKDKWTIRKYPTSAFGNPNPFPWFAFASGVAPTETSSEALYLPEGELLVAKSLPQVLEYIRTEMRTVEVELPKVEEHHTITSEEMDDLTVISFPSYTHVSTDDGDYQMDIGHEELKPLGEYLLALHYSKVQK